MRFFGRILAFGLGLALGILLLVGLNQITKGLWLPFGFAVVIAGLLHWAPWLKSRAVATPLALAAGAWICWGWSATSVFTFKKVDLEFVPTAVMGFVALVSSVAACVAILRVPAKQRKPAWKVLLPLAFAILVSLVSSSVGGADPMKQWVMAHLGMGAEAADQLVLAVRKTIHFTFYGCVAWSAAAAARSAKEPEGSWLLFGGWFALTVASFDEMRQITAAGRTGSFWDVLIDLAGALTFLAIMHFRFRPKPKPTAKPKRTASSMGAKS